MLYNATGFKSIYLAYGYTNLRREIDRLASAIQHNFNIDPFQNNVLFMFCGRKTTASTEVPSRVGPVDKVAQEASMWYNKHEEG